MANVKKGLIVFHLGWEKHLRKIGKRFFWKRERIAEKQLVNKELENE